MNKRRAAGEACYSPSASRTIALSTTLVMSAGLREAKKNGTSETNAPRQNMVNAEAVALHGDRPAARIVLPETDR